MLRKPRKNWRLKTMQPRKPLTMTSLKKLQKTTQPRRLSTKRH